MLNVAIILGSTRPNRVGEGVANWAFETASKRLDAVFELVDIRDYNLPLLDEPMPPSTGKYVKPHTKKWAEKIASFDAYLFVTPEYNHGIPGALKNAIDFLFREWHNKSAGFISYGGAGGVRAVEQLRQVMAEIKVADVREKVVLTLTHDFENYTKFKPSPRHEKSLNALIDEVLSWSEALKTLREKKKEAAAKVA